MKIDWKYLLILALLPSLGFAGLYGGVDQPWVRETGSLYSAANAEYLDWQLNVDWTKRLEGVQRITAGDDNWVEDHGQVFSSVDGGPPSPGVCYRASFDCWAFLFNTATQAASQGWGSAQYCEPTDPPDEDYDVPGYELGPGGERGTPLVVDLLGDGVETSGVEDWVVFDIDADGHLDAITWTSRGGDDAFLWVDLNGNNAVDDGSELFGMATVLESGETARHGFEALKHYDQRSQGGNEDGKISSADSVWNHLRLWVDANHDGVSQGGEIWPIMRSHVEELHLSHNGSLVPDKHGNLHLVGSYLGVARQSSRPVLELKPLHDVFFLRVVSK